MLRKIFLTFILVCLFTALAVFYAWNRLNVDQNLRKFLQTELQDKIGERSTIAAVKLGLGSLHLEDVQLAFRNEPYDLRIQDMRLEFSLDRLFKGGFKPKDFSEEITFHKPKLTLYYDSEKKAVSGLDLNLPVSDSSAVDAEIFYQSVLKQYDFIKRITVSDGEIVLVDTSSHNQFTFARKINGWAYTNDKDQAWFRLAGHLFESRDYNMVLYGQLDLDRGGFDFINVDLHDYQINQNMPVAVPDYFENLAGLVNGHLVVTERLTPPRGFDLAGNLRLRQGKIKIRNKHLYFDDIALDAEVKDWNLNIKKASLSFNGSPTRVEGKITNLLKPEFDLHLNSDEVHVEQFLATYLPEKKLPFSGLATVEASISHSLNNPYMEGKLRMDSLGVFGKHVTDFKTHFNYEQPSLNVTNISGQYATANLKGSGSVEFTSDDQMADFDFVLDGDFSHDLSRLGLNAARQCYGKAVVNVYGPLDGLTGLGEYEMHLQTGDDETFDLNGYLSYSGGRFTINSSAEDQDLKMNATIYNIFPAENARPEDKRIKLKFSATDFQNALVFSDDKRSDFIRNRYRLNMSAEGDSGDLRISVDCLRRDNYEQLIHLALHAQIDEQSKAAQGDVVLFPNSSNRVAGDVALDVTDSTIRIRKFNLGNKIAGQLDLTKDDFTPNTGKITISGADLSSLVYLLGSTQPKYDGKLYGRLTLNNDGKPNYKGSFWLIDAFYRDVGPFKADMGVEGDASRLTIKRLSIDKIDTPFLKAEGTYDFATQALDLTLAGADVDVSDALRMLTDRDDIARGDAFIQVYLKGRLPKIPVYGQIQVHNGGILMFNFDEALLDFGTPENNGGSYLSADYLHVQKAVIQKGDEFTLQGSASLPHRSGPELDVNLSGDGNFLSLLSDLEGFFVDSRSQGHLDLHLSGSYTRPDFSRSHFSFRDGYLELGAVVHKIENLQGDLEIDEPDYGLNIKKLQGTIGGRYFAISNTLNLSNVSKERDEPYEPLRIAGDDLNLGALMLTTAEHGVPLNIPGLMEEGEIGYYALVGRTPEERFFVAGPWEHPEVRGEVRIRNANLMYPFDESAGEGDPFVMNILDNLRWDVKAVSVKDTRYVRQFRKVVFVDMEVDAKNSHLTFAGVLKDSTFRISGQVLSTRGTFDYSDLSFRVERFGAEFTHASLDPVLYGRAWTVVRDTANTPSDVYLTLYTVDDVTHEEVSKGRWDRIQIKLSSEYPKFDESQSDILATLGYSTENMEERAINAVGYSTDNLLFRPLMRPIERQLERHLGLDVVRFSYAITRNFLDSNFSNEELSSTLSYLRSSKVVLGKYLTGDLYFLYSAELEAGIDYQFVDEGVGLRHFLGLEYRLNPRLLLQFEYDYNTLLQTHKDDKKVQLRHSFLF